MHTKCGAQASEESITSSELCHNKTNKRIYRLWLTNRLNFWCGLLELTLLIENTHTQLLFIAHSCIHTHIYIYRHKFDSTRSRFRWCFCLHRVEKNFSILSLGVLFCVMTGIENVAAERGEYQAQFWSHIAEASSQSENVWKTHTRITAQKRVITKKKTEYVQKLHCAIWLCHGILLLCSFGRCLPLPSSLQLPLPLQWPSDSLFSFCSFQANPCSFSFSFDLTNECQSINSTNAHYKKHVFMKISSLSHIFMIEKEFFLSFEFKKILAK